MQRRYRQSVKRVPGLPKNIRLLFAAVLLAAGIGSVIPQEYLCGMLAKGIAGRQPYIVDYSIHIQRPRLGLAQRLIFPQIFCYARQTDASWEGQALAASGAAAEGAEGGVQTAAEEAGSAKTDTVEGTDQTGADSGVQTAAEETDSAKADALEGTGSEGQTAPEETEVTNSMRLSVDTRAQAELLQENIYDSTAQNISQTETDLTGGDQTAEDLTVSQAQDQAASRLTVFDEITGQGTVGGFSPVQQKYYNLSEFDSFEALIEEFYVVDASTRPTASLINLTSLTSYDCTISKEDAAPQILIYHSHSQETYADSDENDPSTTIVGVGEHLARLLESYGYSVLHHEGTYDVPSRDDAYSNALPSIEALLEEYPSIEVVIDLHRDAVAEGTKLIYTYEGKDYARFMFFNGISRTANGPIEYLYNENLEANLAFSFQAQVVAESYFPGVTRGIYLKAWRYNMHLMPRYMLIELGAQTNTVEEAMNTCEILAFVLDQVLSGGE